jgi:hypothetical protein
MEISSKLGDGNLLAYLLGPTSFFVGASNLKIAGRVAFKKLRK